MEKRKTYFFNHVPSLIPTGRKLHVLDSLPKQLSVANDAALLQPIVLQLFQGEKYKTGRITSNLAQVIQSLWCVLIL
jgi:hypothetical protein